VSELPTLVHPLTPAPGDDAAADAPVDRAELRAREAARRAKHHRFMLWMAAVVIVFTFLLEVRPDQRVAFRGLPAFPLPESCGSKMMWGIECPGCGLTRSFIWAGRGEWLRSYHINRVGFLMMLAFVGQIPYRLAMLGRYRRGEPTDSRWPTRIGSLLIAALFLNWGLKLLGL